MPFLFVKKSPPRWRLGAETETTINYEKKTTLFRPPAGRPAPALAGLRFLRRRPIWPDTVLQYRKWQCASDEPKFIISILFELSNRQPHYSRKCSL